MMYLIGVIIVLIIIILYLIRDKYKLTSNYLYGMWWADDEFCKESKIKNMYLFIGELKKFTSSRLCYLVIFDEDGDFIANQKVELNFGINKVSFKGVENIIPNNLSYILDIAEGKMKLFDKKTKKVYACLNKDLSMTKYIDNEIIQ